MLAGEVLPLVVFVEGVSVVEVFVEVVVLVAVVVVIIGGKQLQQPTSD
jgi:hypothetical protein